MKQFLWIPVLFAILSISTEIHAQTVNLPGTPTSPHMESTPPVKKEEMHKQEGPLIPEKQKVSAQGQINYTSPGVIAYQGGGWVGVDNLLNVGKNIDVKVEITKPLGKTIPLDENIIRKQISEAFEKNGIITHVDSYTDKPPLPLFHLLIMINPIDKGFCTFCEARLFEQVTLPRVFLPDDVFFQAITWEKQDLLVSSPEDMLAEFNKSLADMVVNFLDRYKYYKDLQNQMR